MKTNLIDIHCHLDFPDFNKDREEVIKRASDNGIGMITVGATEEGSEKAVQIAEKYNDIFAAAGIHPHDAEKESDIDRLKKLAGHPKVVAIGECGLDFFRNREIRNSKSEIRNKQIKIFKKQIELALELDKPLMIHCRDAHKEVLEILTSHIQRSISNLRGNVHFFTGGLEEAGQYMDLGFSFSFTGVITFTENYDDVIRKLPMDKIMVETDAPFVAPVPYRGKRCEPAYVEEVAKKIAEIKNISFEEVCGATTENAVKLFGLK